MGDTKKWKLGLSPVSITYYMQMYGGKIYKDSSSSDLSDEEAKSKKADRMREIMQLSLTINNQQPSKTAKSKASTHRSLSSSSGSEKSSSGESCSDSRSSNDRRPHRNYKSKRERNRDRNHGGDRREVRSDDRHHSDRRSTHHHSSGDTKHSSSGGDRRFDTDENGIKGRRYSKSSEESRSSGLKDITLENSADFQRRKKKKKKEKSKRPDADEERKKEKKRRKFSAEEENDSYHKKKKLKRKEVNWEASVAAKTLAKMSDNKHAHSSSNKPESDKKKKYDKYENEGVTKQDTDGDWTFYNQESDVSDEAEDPTNETSILGDNSAKGMERGEEIGTDRTPQPVCKPVAEPSYISDRAAKMMKNMGYKPGTGLGAAGTGIVEPIKESLQKGRRGLGMSLAKVTNIDSVRYDPKKELCVVIEEVRWLNGTKDCVNPPEEWILKGPKKDTIDDEIEFCDADVLERVLNAKNILDRIGKSDFQRARDRANPFETIGKSIFMNRAAVKMANMDKVFDYMFTAPRNQDGSPVVHSHQLLYFADVCAGPGGFSEYVLWRKKWSAKGFGFTLRGDCDFKLSQFSAGSPTSFEPFYGAHDDGDIFKRENIKSFAQFVMDYTDKKGVHFMMADGGFSVEGQENIQELLSKQLYLCQFAVALAIVRPEGHFVCKLFDLFTPFSVGLVYLMYRCFRRVAIHKPNSSRPANSERYIICKWKKADTDNVFKYLFNLNDQLNDLKGSDTKEDIVEIVPLSVLKADTTFYEYICKSNNMLGDAQSNNLAKIISLVEDPSMECSNCLPQVEARNLSIIYWELPDQKPLAIKYEKPEALLSRLVDNDSIFMKGQPEHIDREKEIDEFISIFDWHVALLGAYEGATFFLSGSFGKTYSYSYFTKKWTVESDLILSPDTLLYGEVVQELVGEKTRQMRVNSLHIIDAFVLGGRKIGDFHYTQRLMLCRTYVQSIWKKNSPTTTLCRVKEVCDLENVRKIFDELKKITTKNLRVHLAHHIAGTAENYFIPRGLIFINATKPPWNRFYSKKYPDHRYYSTMNKEPRFENNRPKDACASFKDCYSSARFRWLTNEKFTLNDQGPPVTEDPFVMHLQSYVDFSLRKAQGKED